MLVQQRPRPSPAQQLVHQVSTQAPPSKGINALDPLAQMAPDDAVELDNMISADLGLTVRGGWREYATNIGGGATHEVRTVMTYNGAPANAIVSPLATSDLYAATEQGIYFIEGGGNFNAVAPLIALSGNPNAGTFSCAMFTSSGGGQYLVACSETDGGFLFNGTSWMKMTSVGGPGPGIITGVNPADFVQVCVWKKRLLFVQRTSAKMWILDVGAIGGVAQVFDFGPVLQHGGTLLALASWTMDAGAGIDDRLVIIGSSGDLAIYQGTDPTDATKFSNVGIWYVGQPPVGRRCFTSSGGNVFVLTVFGLIPVNHIVNGGLDNVLTSDTDMLKQLRKIQSLLHDDFDTLLNIEGWEVLSIPGKAMLHIARPLAAANDFTQYVFQEHSLAWSRMRDIPCTTFATRLNEVYGGTLDGRVLVCYDGFSDGIKLDGTGEVEIRSRVTPAFSYFGDPALLKQALMIRVNFMSRVTPSYTQRMNLNFALGALASTPAVAAPSGDLWDVGRWDRAFWAGAARAFGEWRSIEGMGYSLAASIFVTSLDETVMASIEYMLKQGGPF